MATIPIDKRIIRVKVLFQDSSNSHRGWWYYLSSRPGGGVDGIEEIVAKAGINYSRINREVHIVRYADDIVVTGPSFD